MDGSISYISSRYPGHGTRLIEEMGGRETWSDCEYSILLACGCQSVIQSIDQGMRVYLQQWRMASILTNKSSL